MLQARVRGTVWLEKFKAIIGPETASWPLQFLAFSCYLVTEAPFLARHTATQLKVNIAHFFMAMWLNSGQWAI